MLMCNLFSIFDPSLSLFSSSWLMLLLIFITPLFYFNSSLNSLYVFNLYKMLNKEIKFTLPKNIKGLNTTLISLFSLILIYNFLALFPHLFSLTSHLLLTLPLAYTLWMTVIIFNLTAYFKYFTSHFIPLGTPIFLMSFMVIVEVLSNIIRPLALTFRLTANMMAGHLLMSLICGMMLKLNFLFSIMGIMTQTLLVMMEMGVAFIQSYVFITLILLYYSEGMTN